MQATIICWKMNLCLNIQPRLVVYVLIHIKGYLEKANSSD